VAADDLESQRLQPGRQVERRLAAIHALVAPKLDERRCREDAHSGRGGRVAVEIERLADGTLRQGNRELTADNIAVQRAEHLRLVRRLEVEVALYYPGQVIEQHASLRANGRVNRVGGRVAAADQVRAGGSLLRARWRTCQA